MKDTTTTTTNRIQEKLSSPQEGSFNKDEFKDILNNEIIQKKNELIKQEEYRKDYEEKVRIIDTLDIDPREVRNMKIPEEKKKEYSIINKAIVIERLDGLLNYYKKKEIPEERITANKNEIMEALDDDNNLMNNTLHGIAKILRRIRYNFDGIILEQGQSNEYIYQQDDGTLKRSDKEQKTGECLITKGDKTLVRHLEGKDIKKDTMMKALKEGIAFYEEYYLTDFMKDVTYLTSGSRLRNREFRDLYTKATGKTGNTQETIKRMNIIGGKFIAHEDETFKQQMRDKFTKDYRMSKQEIDTETKKMIEVEVENEMLNRGRGNDKFLEIERLDINEKQKIRDRFSKDYRISKQRIDDGTKKMIEVEVEKEKKLLPKKENTKRITEIKAWLDRQDITKENIYPEKTDELIEKRNSIHKVKLTGLLVTRALFGPITSTMCVIPIENIKYEEFLVLSPEQFDQGNDGRRKFDKEAQEAMLAGDKKKAFELFDKQEKIINVYIRRYSKERLKRPSKELLRFHQVQLLAYQEKNTEAIKILRGIQPSNIGITEAYYQATIAFLEHDKEKLQEYAKEKNDSNHEFMQRFWNNRDKTYLEVYGNKAE